MLDRASTFADKKLLGLLEKRLIPVAIDQHYQRRQQDAEGEFYRKIAGQSPRKDFKRTTQGFYVATPSGELLLYNNNRDAKKITRLTDKALREFEKQRRRKDKVPPLDDGKPDPRWNPQPPAGGLVVRVHTKVLGGYERAKNDWQRILHAALGRDNLWVTADEHKALGRGGLPDSLLRRIARFHLVDNTRGEPPMWRAEEVEDIDIQRRGTRIRGTVRLATKDGKRSYHAAVLGFVEVERRKVERFDLIFAGRFEGEGRYTRGAPPGRFPLAVSFTLADGKGLGDTVPPQGSRGWIAGYLR